MKLPAYSMGYLPGLSGSWIFTYRSYVPAASDEMSTAGEPLAMLAATHPLVGVVLGEGEHTVEMPDVTETSGALPGPVFFVTDSRT